MKAVDSCADFVLRFSFEAGYYTPFELFSLAIFSFELGTSICRLEEEQKVLMMETMELDAHQSPDSDCKRETDSLQET